MATAESSSGKRVACPLCQDTGWKVAVSAAAEGKAQPCDCRRQRERERMLEQAGIPARYVSCLLENFEIQPPGAAASPSLRQALGKARAFVEDYIVRGRRTGLLLSGPCGVGKTHLGVGMVQKLMLDYAIPCRFADHRELLKRIQATYDPRHPQTEAAVIGPYLDAEVLLLDDLGVGRATEWALETLHYILNARYSRNRTTLITTNYEDELPRPGGSEAGELNLGRPLTLAQAVGERLRSRLYEMCEPLPMRGDDFRRGSALHRHIMAEESGRFRSS